MKQPITKWTELNNFECFFKHESWKVARGEHPPLFIDPPSAVITFSVISSRQQRLRCLNYFDVQILLKKMNINYSRFRKLRNERLDIQIRSTGVARILRPLPVKSLMPVKFFKIGRPLSRRAPLAGALRFKVGNLSFSFFLWSFFANPTNLIPNFSRHACYHC